MLLAGIALACGASGPAPREVTLSAESVLDPIAALLAHRPFVGADVAKALGATLAPDAASNPYFAVFRSTAPTPRYRSIEVREPTAASEGKGGLVLVELGDECLRTEQVGDRFGARLEAPPSMPTAHQPADSPRYDRYPQPWGEVRLGFRPSDGCLVSIVLDAS
ncbi:MAG: hypothetical protein ABMB14_03820 [Myxococcota bacterium]